MPVAVVEAITESKDPLLVIHLGAATDGAAALHEVVEANGVLDHRVDEAGLRGAGQAGAEILLPSEKLELQGVAQVPGERQGFVGATAKTAVEGGIAGVGVDADPGQAAKGDAVHLVQRFLAVAGAVALPDFGTEPYLPVNLHAGAGGQALKKKLVEQPGLNQGGIERGQIAEIVVVQAEFKDGDGLVAKSGEAASQTKSCAGHGGRSGGGLVTVARPAA